MGGKTQGGGWGSTVKRKGRAVLGIDHSGPGPWETCSSTNAIHCRRLSFIGGSKPQFSPIFTEFKHLFFRKAARVSRLA